MNDNPNYYAILTAEVRYDKRLSSSEKLFFAEVTALSNKTGKCWASNKYFAELYGVSKSTVSGWARHLCECGYIDMDYQYDGKQIKKRFISVNNPSGIHLFEGGYSENQKGGIQNIEQGYSEKGKGNTTRYNTTSSNTYSQRIIDTVSDIDQIEDKNVVLACHLWHDVNSLQPNNKTTQRAKVKTWAEPIRLMVEQDDRTYEEIWDLWKRVQKDEFWITNILSPAKLRDKFDQLSIKLKPQKPQIDEQFIDSLF